MKRQLPTVSRRGSHGRRIERPVAPRERTTAAQPLVTIGYVNHAREAGKLAVQLCAALAKRGVSVGVLMATHSDEPATEVSLGSFLEAGASGAKSVLVPPHGGIEVLSEALARLSDSAIVIGLGNVLSLFYRPIFSIVVTGHRRQLVSDDTQILQADLEVTSPSDGLADELAKIFQGRVNAAPPP